MRAAYAFSNLQDFLDIYYQGANVLMTEEDFRDLALAYFARLHADGGRHAEIFFDPETHTGRGLPFSIAIDGLLAGMKEAEATYGITSKLIMCFLRHLDESIVAQDAASPPSRISTASPASASIIPRKATRPPNSPASSRPPAKAVSRSAPTPARRARQPTSMKPSTSCMSTASTMAIARSKMRL